MLYWLHKLRNTILTNPSMYARVVGCPRFLFGGHLCPGGNQIACVQGVLMTDEIDASTILFTLLGQLLQLDSDNLCEIDESGIYLHLQRMGSLLLFAAHQLSMLS